MFLRCRYVPLERVFPPTAPKPTPSTSPGVKQEIKTEVKSEPGLSNGTNGASGSNGAAEKGPLHGMKFTIIGESSFRRSLETEDLVKSLKKNSKSH